MNESFSKWNDCGDWLRDESKGRAIDIACAYAAQLYQVIVSWFIYFFR